ncbi:MAG: PCRF domain-containing protein [Clostridia bacterium]|nr:PCRF domain-containing protein [Clostridia bacterium]
MLDLDENKRDLQELKDRFFKLIDTIGTKEKLEAELKKLEEKTIVTGFWNDTKNANNILRDIKEVKNKYTSIVSINNDLDNLIETNEFLMLENDDEMANDLDRSTSKLRESIEKLETKMFLSGKFDRNNAIITLHPGAGGTESQDWAQMLYRMYSRWASRNRIYFERD